MTQVEGGFHFNLGPHALYVEGAARRSMNDLGVEVKGSLPPSSGLWAVLGDRLHILPSGVLALLRTDLLSLREKLQVAGLLSKLLKRGGQGWYGHSCESWLEEPASTSTVKMLLGALLRLSTYANAPSLQDAGSALDQLRLALRANVLYLDGGWQTLVAGLRSKALEAGALVDTRSKVESIGIHADRWSALSVRLADGTEIGAAQIVLATPPQSAARLLQTAGVEPAWQETLHPVRAACLDLGLSKLPRPDRLFALGIDRPLYLSVHSVSARLCADKRALVHVAKYLGSEAPEAREEIEAELETFMDLVQPGWRDSVLERRLLPSMTVSHALAEASRPRPAVVVEGLDDVFLAGDWIGDEGLLADAAVASARCAVSLILQCRTERKAA